MSNLLLICGSLFLSSSPTADAQTSTVYMIRASHEVNRSIENTFTAFNTEIQPVQGVATSFTFRYKDNTPCELDLNEIDFIEPKTQVDLGFETADYLPDGFNPYEPFVDLNAIPYIDEVRSEQNVGFDTSTYLPEHFDLYKYEINVNSIHYIEEAETDLNFDTVDYLPEGFDPYKLYLDLNKVEYIDMEEMEWKFGFETKTYLPADFDPFISSLTLSEINYIEENEIDLGFDSVLFIRDNQNLCTAIY